MAHSVAELIVELERVVATLKALPPNAAFGEVCMGTDDDCPDPQPFAKLSVVALVCGDDEQPCVDISITSAA